MCQRAKVGGKGVGEYSVHLVNELAASFEMYTRGPYQPLSYAPIVSNGA